METFDQLTSSSFELLPCLRCRDKTLIIARQCLMVLEANQEVCQGFAWRKLLTLIDLQRYINSGGGAFLPSQQRRSSRPCSLITRIPSPSLCLSKFLDLLDYYSYESVTITSISAQQLFPCGCSIAQKITFPDGVIHLEDFHLTITHT